MGKKAQWISKGAPCPKCSRPMDRFSHPSHWQPRPKQPFYFSYWDKCTRCRHMQMYEKAKVYVSSADGDAASRMAAIKGQLGEA